MPFLPTASSGTSLSRGVKIPAASGGALEGRSLSCWGNLSPKPPNKDAIPPHRKQWGILASFREFAPAKVPLDALPEVERPCLPIRTHLPVSGQHWHKIVPWVFLHQGFVYRRILGGEDEGHEYGIVLFTFQLHRHLQAFHLGWSGSRRRWGGGRLRWRKASQGQQHHNDGHATPEQGFSSHDYTPNSC